MFDIEFQLWWNPQTSQNIKRLDGAGYEYFFSCESLQSFPKWETDTKISCEQTLQKGDGPKTSWTREVTNDGELILVTILSEAPVHNLIERVLD